MELSGKRILAAVLLLALASACTPVENLKEYWGAEGTHWVGSWAASPMASSENAFASEREFENQTIRHIVHGSMGGNQVRIRISNAYGDQDLEIGSASVGLQTEGSRIRPGTLRELQFSGQDSITVPPGAYVMSDPVELRSGDYGDFVVSMYLPESTGSATMHSTGLQTSYISEAGDHTGRGEFPVMETTESVFFLSGVEVATSRRQSRTMVAFGDSITDGTGSTVDRNMSWPAQFARRLETANELHVGVLNQGIAGNRLLHDVVGENALARFDRDALSWENVAYVVVMIGINDLGFSEIADAPFDDEANTEAVSVDEMIAGYRQLIARAHRHGARIYGATLLPYQGAGYYSEAGESKRQAINAWIRGSGEFDGVIDFDRALRDPQNPQQIREDLHSGDWLHPNDAGYAAMAEAIDMALFR